VLFLLLLGNWQLRRLEWKTQLTHEITQALHQPPLTLSPGADFLKTPPLSSLNYRPLLLKGRYLHSYESFLWGIKATTSRLDPLGQGLLTPFLLSPEGGKGSPTLVLIHRGWIPFPPFPSDSVQRPEGETEIKGLLRLSHPSPWDKNTQDRKGYWTGLTVEGMMEEARVAFPHASVLPFYVQLLPPGEGPSLPMPLEATPRLVNNHLEYAFTWYSLAMILCLIYGLFAYRACQKI
jgi:surfeit locus 1 family protein